MRPMFLVLSLMAILSGPATPPDEGAASSPSGTPAATCSREPRTVEELRRLASPAPSGPLAPTSLDDLPTQLPTGTAVDARTGAAIRSVMEQLGACFLAGDQLGGFAYFSDGFVRSLRSFTEDELLALATTTPTAEPDQSFYSVEDVSRVERLDDGRVGALVTAGGGCERSQPKPTCVNYVLFVEEEGLWLIDGTINELVVPGEPFPVIVAAYLEGQGTPVATPGT